MPTQLIHPVATADYRAMQGVSQSTLKHIADSPAHYAWHRDNPTIPTPAMEFGSLCDSLLFGTDFPWIMSPYPDFKSKEAREWRDTQKTKGVTVFTVERMTEAQTLVANARSKKTVQEIMETGQAQVAMLWEHPSGIQLKGLADWVSHGFFCIADFKTTGSGAGESEFQKTIINFGYDVQAAFYTDMFTRITGEYTKFAWIVAETEPPYEVATWVASTEILDRGRARYTLMLDTLKRCLDSGDYPGYPDAPRQIQLPRWAIT